MIDLVKKFFGKSTQNDTRNQKRENYHDIRVATCAILLEIANIDGEFSDAEKKEIISILKTNYQLSDEHVAELIEASKEELKQSIDLWQFTNLINQNYSTEEKIHIIEMIWKIIYTDGKLDKHEDYLIHKLANLLRLKHNQLIDAKLKITCSDC
ncbi:MAG: TerB family tellurite resistance protein [Pseudomonadota bacterium]